MRHLIERMKGILFFVVIVLSLVVLAIALAGWHRSDAAPSINFPKGGVWTEWVTNSASYIIENRHGWLTVHKMTPRPVHLKRVLSLPW